MTQCSSGDCKPLPLLSIFLGAYSSLSICDIRLLCFWFWILQEKQFWSHEWDSFQRQNQNYHSANWTKSDEIFCLILFDSVPFCQKLKDSVPICKLPIIFCDNLLLLKFMHIFAQNMFTVGAGACTIKRP